MGRKRTLADVGEWSATALGTKVAAWHYRRVDPLILIREIERRQLRLDRARARVREAIRRQEDRLEMSRRVLAVARRSTVDFDPDDEAVQDAGAERLSAYAAKLGTD